MFDAARQSLYETLYICLQSRIQCLYEKYIFKLKNDIVVVVLILEINNIFFKKPF